MLLPWGSRRIPKVHVRDFLPSGNSAFVRVGEALGCSCILGKRSEGRLLPGMRGKCDMRDIPSLKCQHEKIIFDGKAVLLGHLYPFFLPQTRMQ